MSAKTQMTGEEFAKDIEKLGMSPRVASEFLGFDLRQARRIKSKKADLRLGEYLLLKTMLALNLTPENVRQMAGMSWPKPRDGIAKNA